MIKKKRRILYVKLIILLLGFLVLLRIFTLVLSRYESESKSIANVDMAFYLLKEDFSQMSLNLATILPQKNEYVYTFSIGNQDGIKTAEVDLEYDLTLRTTTNLPLSYELYMNQNYTDSNAESIIESNNVEADDYNTYFRTITTPKQTLYYRTPTTNVYQLVVHFPENYNTVNYQDIIELLEIKVDAKQLL